MCCVLTNDVVEYIALLISEHSRKHIRVRASA